jgi:hypothetical protein
MRDPEIVAFDRRFRKEEEVEDIQLFLEAYERATGETLSIEDVGEAPDAICSRADGTIIGVEHTRVRRSPEGAHWDAVLNHKYEMDVGDTLDEVNRLIFQKAQLRKKFRVANNILIIALYETDFDVLVALAKEIPDDYLVSTGFNEIWLADFKGVRDGAHREVRLFGLYPVQYRQVTDRSAYDQKPYG